jgi:hypothetical protein
MLVLGVKIPEHKNLYKYSLKNEKPSLTSSQSSSSSFSTSSSVPHNSNDSTNHNHQKQVEWVPNIGDLTKDDKKRNEKINKYFQDLGENSIPFKDSPAAKTRKEQLQFQIPPHDFKTEKCDNLSEQESHQLKKYVDSVKKNFLGQGQIDVVEVPHRYLTTNPFAKSHDLNAVNNNSLIVNDLMNNLTLNEEFKCRECNLAITSSYVIAERLNNAKYHPKCFKCRKCEQLLVDLIYFHYENEIYCARDLAEKMEIPRCFACDELILVPEYTLADEKSYHLKHFCCIFCDQALAGMQYVIDDKTNHPVCLPCFDKHSANQCAMCMASIAPNDEGVSLKDVHFHLKCFSCFTCEKKLIGARFCLRNKVPFCSSACVNQAQAY